MEHILSLFQIFWEQSNWSTVAAIVSAATSVALGYLTWILARETRVLSRATSQAHVTVTLEPNLWAMRWVDIIVANSGNAVAYEVEVSFDPPLPTLSERRMVAGIPLQQISILRPTQSIKSSLCENSKFIERVYQVSVSWKLTPKTHQREGLTYKLSLADYDGVARLGAANPLVQVAEEMKKLREDWQHVAAGNRRISADVYNGADRQAEVEEINSRYDELMKSEET